jgi:PiT family inorganic phosphate transporter
MEAAQAALWVVVMLVALALPVRLHERLPRRGKFDCHRRVHGVYSSRAHAVLFAAFFNFVAIFIFHLSVAATVGKGIVQPGIVDTHVVFGALVGAITWNVVTWYYGIPSSSSHALIGGIVGAVIAKAGSGALLSAGILKTVAFIFVSPVLGFLLGSLMMLLVSWVLPPHHAVACGFVVPQVAARVGRRLQPRPRRQRRAKDHRHHLDAADRHRLHRGGRRIAARLGHHQLLCRHCGWAPCSAAGASSRPWARRSPSSSRWAASALKRVAPSPCSWPPAMGIPVSTTHTITGAIVGVGSARRASAVRWGVAGNIVWAWIFTIPAAAFVAAVAYWVSLQIF